MTTALHTLSLDELAAGLGNREYSSVELTRYFLDRIKTHNPALNCFVTVTEELALKQAETADRRLADGTAGRLTGVPLAEKDLFCTAGVRTTCGSKMLETFIAPYDATVVERLHGVAPGFGGMPLLGKLNMDEFAMGSSNETSHFGRVANPWDLGRVPGGSSGGSAAAVAAGLTPAATATDTGGSIRQPAAFANLTGIKPTYGRVSRFGMIAFASSLDQGGVLARSALDCALLLGEMAGFDAKDSTSLEMPREDFTASFHAPVAGMKIGLPKEFFGPGMTDAVRSRVEEAIGVYKRLGAEFVEISLPDVGLSVPVYYVVAPAEASSNLARYDGVRYGHRAENPRNLEDLYARSRAEGFGAEVQRRIMIGTYVLSHGYFDAYYLKAQRVRAKIAADFDAAFKKVDFLLSPSTTDVAFPFGQNSDDPVQMYLNDIFTIAANLAGLPAMSVPAGFAADSGLPVGFQLMGPALSEGRLLGLAHAFQRETDFHTQWAKGFA